MPGPHKELTVKGTVTHVFAHRFVVTTEADAILADLTPEGVAAVTLRKGDVVGVTGEMKPSELKVSTFARDGHDPVLINHKKHHDHEPADPEMAKRAATAQGYLVVGDPRRKPKHFEVLVRNTAGEHHELYIELDGRIRNSRPANPAEPKWQAA